MSEYGKSDSDRITVKDIVEGVQEDMCDYCCKYYAPYAALPDGHPDKERVYKLMIKEHCGDCPLERLG